MARSQRIKIDQFSKTVAKVLQDYSEDVYIGMDEVAEAVAKGSAKQISANARGTFGGSGKYARGWTQKRESVSKFGFTWVVYNKSAYQLAHLLEFGHALTGGGRSGHVSGRSHIKSVEEQAIKEYEDKVKEFIGG